MSTFKAYRFDTIREMADNFRMKHTKNPDQIPVDIERIIEFELQIEIRPVDGLKAKLDMEAMLSRDLKVIFIDCHSYVHPSFASRMRFSLAHELGHYILHRDFYLESKFNSPEEWIRLLNGLDPSDLEWYERHANEFAGRLLVPVTPLIAEVENLKREISQMEDIAKRKGITDAAELAKWKASAIANKIAGKFHVSPQTIDMRIRREKVVLP
jgi:Zn-dependent peptidase ImmA (M78 family)